MVAMERGSWFVINCRLPWCGERVEKGAPSCCRLRRPGAVSMPFLFANFVQNSWELASGGPGFAHCERACPKKPHGEPAWRTSRLAVRCMQLPSFGANPPPCRRVSRFQGRHAARWLLSAQPVGPPDAADQNPGCAQIRVADSSRHQECLPTPLPSANYGLAQHAAHPRAHIQEPPAPTTIPLALTRSRPASLSIAQPPPRPLPVSRAT